MLQCCSVLQEIVRLIAVWSAGGLSESKSCESLLEPGPEEDGVRGHAPLPQVILSCDWSIL